MIGRDCFPWTWNFLSGVPPILEAEFWAASKLCFPTAVMLTLAPQTLKYGGWCSKVNANISKHAARKRKKLFSTYSCNPSLAFKQLSDWWLFHVGCCLINTNYMQCSCVCVCVSDLQRLESVKSLQRCTGHSLQLIILEHPEHKRQTDNFNTPDSTEVESRWWQ